MICEIFNTKNESIMSFEIDHFGERMVENEEVLITLSCLFPVESEIWTDSILDKFAPVVSASIGKIEIRSNETETVIGTYTKYAKCTGVSIDYSPAVNKIEGVLTFNRTPEV